MNGVMKRLIIGGKNSGKYEYLLNIGYKNEEIGKDFEQKILYKLNDWIKKTLSNKKNPIEEIEKLLKDRVEYVIVCDEVNCGIIPMKSEEREYIESVGRVCCIIAKDADLVERVYCGIATIIKKTK